MRHQHTIPSGDYVIRHAAYSGCSAPDSDPLDRQDAIAHLLTRARRYAAKGYPVDFTVGIDGLVERVEISTPDDAAMIGDVEGVYRLVPHQIPAWKCWACGDLIAIGETCDCQSVFEEE